MLMASRLVIERGLSRREVGGAGNLLPCDNLGFHSLYLVLDELECVGAEIESHGRIFGRNQLEQRLRRLGRVAGLVAALRLPRGADRIHDLVVVSNAAPG